MEEGVCWERRMGKRVEAGGGPGWEDGDVRAEVWRKQRQVVDKMRNGGGYKCGLGERERRRGEGGGSTGRGAARRW